MRYAIYVTYIGGLEDSCNCVNAEDRDGCIKFYSKRKYIKEIKYCPIYASGEYGKRITVR